MNAATADGTKATAKRPRHAGAVFILLLLSPFIAEVLSGSTRTSILFVYVPEVMVWGVGALLCRELVRRWRAGSTSLLFLGLALSVAEEFIIQQTSLAPLPFPGSDPSYGRMWGVNLVYLLFMLGFESVWVVVVPVQVAELFFPRHAEGCWLRMRGIIVACIVFLLGSRIAWYGWTQQARPRMGAAPYHPPLTLIALGFALIAGLIAAAYFMRGLGRPEGNTRQRTAPAWVGGLTAFAMGAAWFELIGQQFVHDPLRPFWIAIAAGFAWAAIAYALFLRWSSHSGWSEVHRFAAACGAALGCMATPYLTIASWPRVDVVGIVIFDVMALMGFTVLGRKVAARAKTAEAVAPNS